MFRKSGWRAILLKQEILDLIDRSNLLPGLKSEVKNLLRETIDLNLELVSPGTLPVGSSKIGGRPDLPEDFEWPWVDDRPLLFVGQIKLSDLAEIKPELFPAEGILYFFDDYHGDDDGWKVWKYNGPTDRLVRMANPNEPEEDRNTLKVYDDIRLNSLLPVMDVTTD